VPTTHEERLQRARISLEGLAVGDAFGDRFFVMNAEGVYLCLSTHTPPPAELFWRYTDDTNMALSIYQNLSQYSEINQDALAQSFAKYYDSSRGYGAAMHGLLGKIGSGIPWQQAVGDLFSGQGSHGNGAAMRVNPIGAYFADDIQKSIEQARLSAEITHAHPEGIAGAIAVSVATSIAWQLGRDHRQVTRQDFIDLIHPHVPNGIVSEKIRHARNLASNASINLAIAALGNGSQITAQDTVPFVLWCAGEKLTNYEEAIWLTASAGGDIDTTCAMVGGIVSMYTGLEGIPADWIAHREPLPTWALGE
jgi:ADP-ribosylglycohydrolase